MLTYMNFIIYFWPRMANESVWKILGDNKLIPIASPPRFYGRDITYASFMYCT